MILEAESPTDSRRDPAPSPTQRVADLTSRTDPGEKLLAAVS